MKKITILALHLGYGGAERCITNLANSLVEKYYVTILTTYKLYDKPAFPLDKRVNVVYLTKVVPNRNDIRYDLKKFKVFSLIKDLMKAVKILHLRKKTMIDAIDSCDSDIIISTKVYFNKLLGEYKNDGVYSIGWEHNYNNHTKKEVREFINSCRSLDRVVVVNKSLQKFYQEEFSKHKIKCVVDYIPNYIDCISKTKTDYKSDALIAVGRLESCKGFLDLIDVFNLVSKKNKEATLTLVGDGKEYQAILNKIISLGLSKKVKMLGYQSQEVINNLYDKSSLYIMTSHTESFGLVMLEAMSHGLPVVGFSSAEGARDLIKDGENGYLIANRDQQAMANKIVELLKDRTLLQKTGANAYKSVKKYTKEEVTKDWEKLINNKNV